MMSAAAPTISREKRKGDDDKRKLTKVLSTKLSIDDYKIFRTLTNRAYQSGVISEDSPSEMLRFFITSAFNELRNKPGFSLL
jgi:hypothetical protein